MRELEKRIKEKGFVAGAIHWKRDGAEPTEVRIKDALEIVEEMRKDIESNATFASKELMVIDRKKWLKWFGEPEK